jgi:hypothetical protein
LLLQCSQAAQLPQPDNYQLRFLRDWLEGREEGDLFLPRVAGAIEMSTWSNENDDDFVALVEGQTWINPEIQDRWHNLRSKSEEVATDVQLSRYLGRTKDFDTSAAGKSGRRIFKGAFMAVMALIPILIVLWLYHVRTTRARINIAIGSTLVVGLLMFGITANPNEVFGATAA